MSYYSTKNKLKNNQEKFLDTNSIGETTTTTTTTTTTKASLSSVNNRLLDDGYYNIVIDNDKTLSLDSGTRFSNNITVEQYKSKHLIKIKYSF